MNILVKSGFLLGILMAHAGAQTVVTPKMGGGQTTAEMVHIDVYYDEMANQLHTQVDDSYGIPELRQLESGVVFASDKPYAVLNGKAYNAQYGWNVGGFFVLPPGTAMWIEQLDTSPGLEVYESWGQNGSYTPIFGTGSSAPLWMWSGVMVHNTYAIRHAATNRLFASYHLYFGDAATGSRSGFEQYDDAFVQLEWHTTPVASPVYFDLGAAAPTNDAPLLFINASNYVTQSKHVLHLSPDPNPVASHTFPYQGQLSMASRPANPLAGGPVPYHAAPGSRLAVQFESLSGSHPASLEIALVQSANPSLVLQTGETGGTNRLPVSSDQLSTDPAGLLNLQLRVSHPGLYCLGFRIVDTSALGLGGSPIHAASELYCVYLQAGITVSSLTPYPSFVAVNFAGQAGLRYFLEAASTLGTASWQTMDGPVAGSNQLQELRDSGAPQAHRFYRVRAEP